MNAVYVMLSRVQEKPCVGVARFENVRGNGFYNYSSRTQTITKPVVTGRNRGRDLRRKVKIEQG